MKKTLTIIAAALVSASALAQNWNTNGAGATPLSTDYGAPAAPPSVTVNTLVAGAIIQTPCVWTNPATGTINAHTASSKLDLKASGTFVNITMTSTFDGIPTTNDGFNADNLTALFAVRGNTFRQNFIGEWMHGDGSVQFNSANNTNYFSGSFIVQSNAVPPIIGTLGAFDGSLWNSNKVLYWVTKTQTNLLSDGR